MFSVSHITLHGCIRAHKIGYLWAQSGFPTHFCTARQASVHSWSIYHSFHMWNDISEDPNTFNTYQLGNEVQILSKVTDLFHVHNEPNWLFKVVRENTDKPVVFDIHDWSSLRESENVPEFDLEMEKYALENASGFVVPSMGYLNRIRKISKKPSTLIYSKVVSPLYPKNPQVGSMPGLAYEGGVKGKTNILYNYPYRNWAQFAKKTVQNFQNGHKVYFYSASSGEDLGDYADEKIVCYETMQYDALLHALGGHTAGLVGSPYPLKDFEDSMPNKLFEYVSAGIPCIVVNAPEAARFVENNGIGIGIRDPSEVYSALEQLTDHHVLRDRWSYTMEGELPRLQAFYEEVMTCNRKRRHIPQLGSQKTV